MKDDLRTALARHREALLEGLRAGPPGDGLQLGRANAAFLESLMVDLEAKVRAKVTPGEGLALAAVGTFGRGAVALRSDADVRIVVGTGAGDAAEKAEAFAQALLYPLWDAGLSVGHQVLEPDHILSLAQEDLTTATSLLDLRPIGSRPEGAIVAALLERAWGGVFSDLAPFLQRLDEEAVARHARLGGSVYLLEPDVKGGAGGLRDLDAARWAVRARYHVADVRGGIWGELVRVGVLVPREAQEIAAAEEFLWRVRNRLHAHAGRHSDRLTFEEQETIAVDMGYGRTSDPTASPADRAEAAERFMQDYYLHARVVTRARERMLERAMPPRRRGPTMAREADMGRGVRLFDGQVTIAGVPELMAEPALALRVYAACVRSNAPVHAYAREAIARAAADPAWCEALRTSPEAAALFVELISTVQEVETRRTGDAPGRRAGSIAAELQDAGVLLAMVPEFRPVTGRVHHDVYHVYTVDVHSVAALDCLRALSRGELANQYPLASRLAAEIARPRPLFLATLLHDVGKGYPDASGSRKNHSKSGAELCETILPRLGFGADDVAEIKTLVLNHLAMYHTATRRDLDDPATIEEFSRLVRTREGLRQLYLLTVADITTTSPTAMTSWKARMLDELYFACDAYLAGQGKSFDEGRIERLREGARALWTGPGPFIDAFLCQMPARYLLANPPESIVAHARVALERGAEPVHVGLVPSRHPDVAELCVVAEDRPGLLARIAAALTAGRLEVLAAQVYTRRLPEGRVEAVDLFWVRARTSDGEVAAVEVARGMERLARDLRAVCPAGPEAVDPVALLRARTGSASPWRERPSPAVPTEVTIDDRASPRHTVIEVFAKDRPGLLFTLARALHELGLSIVLSKINTEGTKVADVFYVNEVQGEQKGSSSEEPAKVSPEKFKGIKETLSRAIESR